MMIPLRNTWKKLHTAYTTRRDPEFMRTLAGLYWHILLITITLIVIGTMSYGFVKFTSVLRGGGGNTPTLSPNAGAAPTLDRAGLEALVGSFSERRARYESFKANSSQIADPSR